MTDQQRLFVDAYLGEARGNAKRAAEIAGYASPRQRGMELKKNPEIAAAINERLAEHSLSVNEALERLSGFARSSMRQAFRESGVEDAPYYVFDLQELFRNGGIDAVKKYKKGQFGDELEFYDAKASASEILRYHQTEAQKVTDAKLSAWLDEVAKILQNALTQHVPDEDQRAAVTRSLKEGLEQLGLPGVSGAAGAGREQRKPE